MVAALVQLLLVGPLPHPDCQRLCLGECHYDWRHRRCADTRVEYIGEDNHVPIDYSPADLSDFSELYHLDDPKAYGSYDTELDSEGNRNGIP